MYTFSAKHFGELLRILDDSLCYIEYYSLEDAREFLKIQNSDVKKILRKEIKELYKDKVGITIYRSNFIIPILATMGKVSIKKKLMKTEIGYFFIPFIKFWPTKDYEEYFNRFDKKKLVEEVVGK